MRIAIAAIAAIGALGLGAAAVRAEPAGAPGKGFWKILVTPHARWVMHEMIDGSTEVLTAETYDVRKLGAADVARIRWTLTNGKTTTDVGGEDGRFTQVAVTTGGLYLLSAEMNDAAVTAALAHKPDRSDPPKAYAGTKRNRGRYLYIDAADVVCIGEGPMPGAGECPDTCDATMCISATKGIIKLLGNWAPGVTVFEQ